ncbi:flagellar protein FlaG [Thiomicrorhabdus lithotrophica]|uniref:Flagellar protein FlaG n=1 Tax=Thiomicrorhabdus lithotrophica TaxID=2949997 RepID=A0ABY8CBK8_9GAMM|nr:flagellar protein FlaG [Thiomicrorhabdus lithotrophica]WEJ63370.1 flagellar protein FlaG [Thiomicrorhabdus lithotrophica]
MDVNSVNPLASSQGVKSTAELNEPTNLKVITESSAVAPKSDTQKESTEVLKAQADSLNNVLSQLGQTVTFDVDESTQYSVVKVVDKTTDEIIKQYPNEGSLQMMKNIQDYLDSVQKTGSSSKEGLTGTLFNEII